MHIQFTVMFYSTVTELFRVVIIFVPIFLSTPEGMDISAIISPIFFPSGNQATG